MGLITIVQLVSYVHATKHQDTYYKISNPKLEDLVEKFVTNADNSKYETEYILMDYGYSTNVEYEHIGGHFSFLEDFFLVTLPFIKTDHIICCGEIGGKEIIVRVNLCEGNRFFHYITFDTQMIAIYFNEKKPKLAQTIINEYNEMIHSEYIKFKQPLYFPKKEVYFS